MHRSRLRPSIVLAALGLVAGCSCGTDAPAPLPVIATTAPTAVPAPEPAPVDDSAYGLELVAMNAQIEALEQAATRYATDWTRTERLSYAYEQRASLTGDHEDYQRALDAMDRAFRAAPEGTGPFLSRAHLNYTLHRLDAASADLDAADRARLMTPADRNSISTLRGDIAFHRGDLVEAERRHRATDEVLQTSSSAFRVAYDLWQTARFDEAERWLGLAEARVPTSDARTRAWIRLQMGLMDLDRGRWASALAHYEEADRRYSGWWLVHEHIAEVLVELGRLDEAEERYRDVVARTDNPELIDALADLLESRGETAEVASLRSRADALFEDQLQHLPEAAYGHALEHFLEHGTPARALALAEANHRTRPGGEATVRLAQALLRSERAPEARARLEALLETPYRTAELHATMVEAARATGDEALATEHARLATEIHPSIMEE